ncbi:MAG: radical SAM protein [Bdellovibrionaceae bacterium]|nr:radical SAM protein [Bdellovibrionales bacterium]MCB9082899.1 radical SAM protein [Pseudobdellovibrionaceae bacterium]
MAGISVLVSSPGIFTHRTYLPYTWARLKTYFEVDHKACPVIKSQLNWLPPLFQTRTVEDHLAQYDLASIDVLGISQYSPNWEINIALAKKIKEANPNCVVISGGPNNKWDFPQFFADHPEIDGVVLGEGEWVFASILEALVKGNDWRETPGVASQKIHNPPRAPYLELESLTSPWTHHHAYFTDLVAKLKGEGQAAHAVWETNRGCPYKCTFCDWGSVTGTKVRMFDLQMLENELRTFAEVGIEVITISDANFGAFKRDIDLIKKVISLKSEIGWKPNIVFTGSKNPKSSANLALRILYENQLTTHFQVGFQHTDDSVLDAVSRSDIPPTKQLEYLQEAFKVGAPIVGVLICGNPGDTPERWMRSFDDLLEWGFHDNIRVHDFLLLPNSPAAQKDYAQKWKIKTLRRRVTENYTFGLPDNLKSHGDIVAGSYSYNLDDFAQMQLISATLLGLHLWGPLKLISIYLRYNQDVRFKDFYSAWVDDQTNGAVWSNIRQRVAQAVKEFVSSEAKEKFIEEYGMRMSWDDYILITILQNKENFYRETLDFLLTHYARTAEQKRLLTDLVHYQKELLISHDYNPEEGKQFHTNYDWHQLFQEFFAINPLARTSMATPRQIHCDIEIRQTHTGLYQEIQIPGNGDIRKYKGWIMNSGTYFRHRMTLFESLNVTRESLPSISAS